MKVKNKTIILKYILGIILVIVTILLVKKFLIPTTAELTAEQLAEKNIDKEKAIVRISASHSRAKESTNVINLTTLAEELNKYAGTGQTTVTEKDSSTIVVTFSETGNQYELNKNNGPELPDGEKYTITYNANGGTGAPESQTKYQGWNVELSTIIPTRNSYTFMGWSTSSSATEVTYFSGATYREDSDITLYAVWELIDTWDGELMVASNRYEDVTGGWTAEGYTGYSSSNSMIDKGVSFDCYADSSWYRIGTNNKVDISDYKTVKFYMYAPDGTTGTHQIYCGLYNNKSDNYDEGRAAKNTSTTYNNVVDNWFEVIIDVSNLTGSYYIASYIYAQNKPISIYKVMLEGIRQVVLADLTTSTDHDTDYSPTGLPNAIHAKSTNYWELSGLNTLTATFSNNLKIDSWGAGGGSYSNDTLYTYLVLNDGTEILLATGELSSRSITVDLSSYSDTQKSKVYLKSYREVDWENKTNTYIKGGASAINGIAQ